MRIVIQLIVVAIAVAVIIRVLGARNSHSGRATKKLGLLLVALAMAVSVFFPKVADSVAMQLGVRSAADLLLYVIALSFIVYAVNAYLGQQDQRDAIYRLARRVALIDAEQRYNKHD